MNPDKNMDISQHTYETRSHVSGSRYSVHSSASSASPAGLRARAKAEAARAAHSYVEKEADLIRQKAELEAHMHVLQIQKAAVSASAEAAVYETVFSMEGDQLHNVPKISTHDPVQRTQEYVQNHTLDQVKTEYPTIEPISNTAPQFPNSAYQQFVSDTPPPAVLPAKFENVPAPKMATGRAHSARKLKPWLVEQIESGKYPGLMWDDDQKTCFRIPWKHAGKQDFRHDEDAAIFKAWAQYKNKYQNGDKLDAATWKTRLRCALNKSPEFQERPERSQLDISEPYKVYRIVPPEEQENPKSGKIAHKRKTPSDSKAKSCSEVDLGEKEPKHVILTLSCIETLEATSCASADSGNGSDTSNNDTPAINQHMSTCDLPQPELLNTTLTILQPPFSHVSHKEMQVTVLYSGVEVSNTVIQSGECKLSAKVPFQNSMGKMEHVLLPLPTEPLDKETQIKTEKLLTFLQAGVMLASNMDGIFAQRQKSCSGRVYWTGPCTNSQVTINKLERDKHVKLFDTQKFLTELELYKMKGGNPPEYQVTLCFGEELSDSDPTEDKLITAKIEQVLAAELVHQATEYLRAADVQEPVKEDSSSPFLITLMPVNTSDSMDI